MNEKTNIDKAYDKLLDIAENSNLSEKLEENSDMIKTEINKIVEDLDLSDQNEDKVIATVELPENAEDRMEDVLQSYDPISGLLDIERTIPSVKEFSENQFNNFVCPDFENIEKIEASILNSDKSIKKEDASLIAAQVVRRMNGATTGFYDNLPTSMKNMIGTIAINSNTNNIKSSSIINRNRIARGIIDEFINEYKRDPNNNMDIESIFAQSQNEIDDIFSEFSINSANIFLSFDELRKKEIDEKIKKCEEENKLEAAQKLKDVEKSIDDAFNLTDFKKFCLGCKIKQIEIDKPDREFSHFNSKYVNHKNSINDIRACPWILTVQLKDANSAACTMLPVAFCKYCTDMSPDNMLDHTFMYYFIRNIITLDRINPKGSNYKNIDEKFKKFYDGFSNNLYDCINNLLERNPRFKNSSVTCK